MNNYEKKYLLNVYVNVNMNRLIPGVFCDSAVADRIQLAGPIIRMRTIEVENYPLMVYYVAVQY